jgi:peptidoglycan/xylan/chitin deacetylase (PgdA/CDA1 family)
VGSIALKVDVDTLRGTLEGVPQLQKELSRLGVPATFLFSLGPDHTGWALKRIFRPGFFKKVSRTSVVEHYGLKTLSYGVLLPAPDIGIKARETMQRVAKDGFEVGIHTWDHIVWHDHARAANAAWTQQQMLKAYTRFSDIFGQAPMTHGAAGWQMNASALEQLDHWQMPYASDGRAPLNLVPYRIALPNGPSKHIQYPTTLPTFDELLGVNEMSAQDAVDHLLQLTATNPNDQVFTLHAELEGQKLLPFFMQLVQSWIAQGHQCVDLRTLHTSWLATGQTRHLISLPLYFDSIANRSGELMMMPVTSS